MSGDGEVHAGPPVEQMIVDSVGLPGGGVQLRHIRQTNRASGCGPACIAMVAAVSEREAIFAMFGEHRTINLYSGWKRLREGMKRLGFKLAAPRQARNWLEIERLSIVGLGKAGEEAGPIRHWVVYEPISKILFDPARPGPVGVERCRRRPRAYAAVLLSSTDRPQRDEAAGAVR